MLQLVKTDNHLWSLTELGVGLRLWELSVCNLKPVPVYRGQGETKETNISLQIGRFHKQGNLHMRLGFGSCETRRDHTHPPESSSLYRGLDRVQPHIRSRWSQ